MLKSYKSKILPFFFLCLFFFLPHLISAQRIHLISAGSHQHATYFSLLAKTATQSLAQYNRFFAYDGSKSRLQTPFELLEALNDKNINQGDIIVFIYNGDLQDPNTPEESFRAGTYFFQMETIKQILRRKNPTLLLTLLNTDNANLNQIRQTPLPSLEQLYHIFNYSGEIHIRSNNLAKTLEKLQNYNFNLIKTQDYTFEAKPQAPRLAGRTENSHLPLFPTPIPPPTLRVPLKGYEHWHNKSSLGVVDNYFMAQLNLAGYRERSYYRLENGFALVVRLEQIEANGLPKREPDRWRFGISNSQGNFSLNDYFTSLFFAREGYFRVLILTVTTQNLNFSQNQISREEMANWVVDGGKVLPENVRSATFTNRHRIEALIYEFKVDDVGETPRLLEEGKAEPATINNHLKWKNLWDRLNRNGY
ncbi:hypothetical protein [Hugenholtzia roseola]|uniref:hypothetical protein n=1 Tax=Hugenholtzia roseola TaxID=1002 RepID=UPI0004053D3F|nr:hypothetical protein [Hugenholtzia roseola]